MTDHDPQPIADQAKKYVSDGGFSLSGMMLMMGGGVLTALTVGVIAGVIGLYFYMVMIFPLIIGGVVAGVQVLMIDKCKIRNPLMCGASGLIAGVVAVTAMHYVDYFTFRMSMNDSEAQLAELQQVYAGIEDEDEKALFAEVLAKYDTDPEIVEARSIDSFIGYIDWSARQGVELSSGTGTSSPTNLGYVGTYVYWGMEALVIAGMCVVITRKRAAKPFCVACDRWMTETEVAALGCNAKSAVKALASGRLDRLPSLFDANQETAISVFDCEGCSGGSAVLQASSVSYHNGARGLTPVGRYEFPAAVVDNFVQTLVAATANGGAGDTASMAG